MIIYKRHIENKLLSLRLSFIILVTTCALSFIYHYDKIGYFTSVVLLTLTFIVLKDFIVSPDSFRISKFYFFGLIKREWFFNKTENIKISTFGTDFGDDGDVVFIDSGVPAPLSILSFFLIFAPPKITMNEFKIEKMDEMYCPINAVRILLSEHEFNYLNPFIRRPQEI